MKNLRQLRSYFRPYRGRILLGFLFVVLSNGLFMLVPRLIQQGVDTLDGNGDRSLTECVVLLMLAAGLSAICRFFIRQTLIVMSRRQEFDLRQDLWQHLQRLSPRFFQQRATGDLMAHLSNDVEAVRMFFGPVLMYSFDNLCRFVFFLGLLLSYSGRLALSALAPLAFLALAIYLIMPIVHRRFTDIQAAFSAMTARVQQNLAGIRVVRSYNREASECERFTEVSADYRRKHLELARVQALFRPLIALIPSFAAVIILWYGGHLVIRGPAAGGITMGQLSAFMFCLVQLIWPMIALGWTFNIAQRADASAGRLFTILHARPEIVDGPDVDHGIVELHGDIEFDRVSLRYTADAPDVLHDLSLHVPAGSTCALIGRTGSGKTSLVNLIPRFYDATTGEIRIDGRPLAEIPLNTLRTHIGFATQEPFLFSESLRHNIAFARPEAGDDELRAAAETAQLAKDIEQFPDGYDAVVGERGLTLSGGQKQRCALARTLLADPRILILDDAFSAVDTDTEDAILQGLRDYARARTTILISHRISTVKDADRIFVLDRGGIAEAGTHEELLEQAGIYADIHRKQQLETELAQI